MTSHRHPSGLLSEEKDRLAEFLTHIIELETTSTLPPKWRKELLSMYDAAAKKIIADAKARLTANNNSHEKP